jgi:hypothetical protein
MEQILNFLSYVLLGLPIISVLLSIFSKNKWQFFIPPLILIVYIWYESIFSRPEISYGDPIRFDLFLLHPLIIIAFISSFIKSGLMWRKKIIGRSALFIILASFICWWYFVLVICNFYY